MTEVQLPETIGDQIIFNSSKSAEAVWLVSPETNKTISFGQVHETILEIGQRLIETGIERGSSIAIASPNSCLLYTSPSPRDKRQSRMPSSA